MFSTILVNISDLLYATFSFGTVVTFVYVEAEFEDVESLYLVFEAIKGRSFTSKNLADVLLIVQAAVALV